MVRSLPGVGQWEAMEPAVLERIVERYPHASAFQRWHMRGRLRLCPYERLTPHLTGSGSVLDIGCGFGHLAWFLREAAPSLRYFGSDIDERKIRLARACPAREWVDMPEFRAGDDRELSGWPGRFGNIVLLDVLYLLPWDAQVSLLDWALGRLEDAPGSALVIKSMEKAEGWSGARAVAEEWIMVHLLRRTRSSGTLLGARPASAYADFARERGWRSECEDLGTFNPSYLLRIHR